MLDMKGWVIFLIRLMTAFNLIIVPDLHQMNAWLYHHKLRAHHIGQPNIYSLAPNTDTTTFGRAYFKQ